MGGAAVALPWVGLVASAAVRVGAAGRGITRGMGLEVGVLSPVAVVAKTVTSYARPGVKLVAGQSVRDVHVTTTGVPPPAGVAVKVYDEKGPPTTGCDALREALVGWVGMADSITGALQPSRATVHTEL